MPRFTALILAILLTLPLVACSGGAKDDAIAKDFSSALHSHRDKLKEGKFNKDEFEREMAPLAEEHLRALKASEENKLVMSEEVHKDYLKAIENFSTTSLESGNTEANQAFTEVLNRAQGR